MMKMLVRYTFSRAASSKAVTLHTQVISVMMMMLHPPHLHPLLLPSFPFLLLLIHIFILPPPPSVSLFPFPPFSCHIILFYTTFKSYCTGKASLSCQLFPRPLHKQARPLNCLTCPPSSQTCPPKRVNVIFDIFATKNA